jgi:DnaJ-class molecular chaperone
MAEPDRSDGSDAEDDDEPMGEDYEELEALDELDLYAILGVTRPAGGSASIAGGESRIRAAYHKTAAQTYRRLERCPEYGPRYLEVSRLFRRIAVAYLVLKDRERRRIYTENGYTALVTSETYEEESVFEADAFEVYEHFFGGTDEVRKPRRAAPMFGDRPVHEPAVGAAHDLGYRPIGTTCS